jgi:hypothetical protein
MEHPHATYPSNPHRLFQYFCVRSVLTRDFIDYWASLDCIDSWTGKALRPCGSDAENCGPALLQIFIRVWETERGLLEGRAWLKVLCGLRSRSVWMACSHFSTRNYPARTLVQNKIRKGGMCRRRRRGSEAGGPSLMAALTLNRRNGSRDHRPAFVARPRC